MKLQCRTFNPFHFMATSDNWIATPYSSSKNHAGSLTSWTCSLTQIAKLFVESF